MTTTTVPLPPGAQAADDFEVQMDGTGARIFRGTRRGTHPCVEIAGIQGHDGTVLRRIAWVIVGGTGQNLARMSYAS